MAFNLVAELQIQAPTNLGRVASQIRGQLKNISATVDVKINPTSVAGLTSLNQQVTLLNTNLRQLTATSAAAGTALSNLGRGFATSSASSNNAAKNLASVSSATASYTKTTTEAVNATEEFGRAAGLAGRRFLGFSVVAGSVVGAIAAIKNGLGEALKFEREFIKLSQIGGATKAELSSLNQEITRLSTNLGVSSKDLLATSITLRQAGLSVKEVTAAMEILAKTTLAPTFDNIKDTTEGAIAVLAQFGLQTKDLEKALGSANAVAAAFAVESKDIITAVQRAGGAFKSVGGDLNEFIALFTSVRQTTRESAESISTGLRTVFTRLQRKDTVDALKDLGINLRFTRQEAIALGQVDLENQFVGAFEGVRRLSDGLKNLRTTDSRFSEVVEQLGGYRQISKVIPLIQQFTVSQKALNIAQSGFASVTTAAEEAQGTFLVKLQKVKEEFLSLARTVASGNAFQGFLDTSLKLARAFIQIGEALSPIIPLLTTLATLKLAANVTSFFSGVTQGFSGTGPKRLARGGVVPGSGTGDTVPAMLTPGEFVVKKSSAQAIGYDKLARMNTGGTVQKFATGGLVKGQDSSFKVGNYDLSRNQVEFLYALAGAKDGGAALLKNPTNKLALNKILGPARSGAKSYDTTEQIFEQLGFAVNSRNGVIQSLTEFRNTIGEARSFSGERREAIKNNKFVKGGKLIIPFAGESMGFVASGTAGGEAGKTGRDTLNAGIRLETLSGDNLGKKTNKTVDALLKSAGVKEVQGGVNVRILGSQPTEDFRSEVTDEVQNSIQGIFQRKFGPGRVAPLSKGQLNTTTGFLFEKYIEGLSGKFVDTKEGADFEYTRSNPGSTLGKAFDKFVFPSPITDTYLDLKSRFNRGLIGDVMKKYLNVKSRDGGLAAALGAGLGKNTGGASPAKKFEPLLKYASGGVVPGQGSGDTVPAMLTPGEFVVKKSSAQAIGYDKLARMNTGGMVQKFAAGGKVLEVNPPKDKVALLYLDSPTFSGRSSSGNVRYILDAKDIAKKTGGRGQALRVITGQSADQNSAEEAVRIVRGGLPTNGKKGALPVADIDAYVATQTQLNAKIRRSLRRQLVLGRGGVGGTFVKDYLDDIVNKTTPLSVKNSKTGRNISTGRTTNAPNDNVAVNIETRPVDSTKGVGSIEPVFNDAVKDSIALIANAFGTNFPSLGLKSFARGDVKDSLIRSSITQQGKGRLFESAIRVIANRQSSNVSDNFDFAPVNNLISNVFGGGLTGVFGDAKISNSRENLLSVARKAVSQFGTSGSSINSLTGTKAGLTAATVNKKSSGSAFAVEGGLTDPRFFQKFASGGAARGTDTVPAMLTPGEFVINKQAAGRIGLGNLKSMNQTGKVQGFAGGGSVPTLSGREVGGALSTGKPVTLSIPEIAAFSKELSKSIALVKADARDALDFGDTDKFNQLSVELLNLRKALGSLGTAVIDVAKSARQAGTDFNSVQDITLQRGGNGRYQVQDASLLTGESVNIAKQRLTNRREAADFRSSRNFEVGQLSGDTARTLAAKRAGIEVFELGGARREEQSVRALQSEGRASQEAVNQAAQKTQALKAKALEAIAAEEIKIKKELIEAEKARIQSLKLGISKEEIGNIAQENVNKALLLKSKIIKDEVGGGKAIGLALTQGGRAGIQLNEEQKAKLAQAEAAAAAQNTEVKKTKKKEESKLPGLGLLALSSAAAYSGTLFDNKQSDIDLAAKSGDTGAVTRRAGAGGALTGLATGAAIGSVFGPIGTGVGAAVGALYGFADASSQAAKDIREAKISQALNELATTIETINRSGLSPTALQKSKIAEKISTVDKGISENAATESNSFFKGALAGLAKFARDSKDVTDGALAVPGGQALFGAGLALRELGPKDNSRIDVKKFIDVTDKERRATIGKELPAIYELLNNESAKLGESFAKTSLSVNDFNPETAKKNLEQLDKTFIEANRALLRPIAELKNVSIEEVAKDFRKSRIEGFGRTRTNELRDRATVDIGQQLGSFLRLEQAVSKVSAAMDALQATSINLNDSFEGTISNNLSTKGSLQSLSSSSLRAELSSISTGLGGGEAATNLGSFTSKFLNVKDAVSSVLPGVLSAATNIDEGSVDIGTNLIRELERVLGKEASADPAIKAILGSVQSTANVEGFDNLKISSKANLSSSVDKLTSGSNPLPNAEEINKKFAEAGNKFVNELIKYQTRLQRVGEQEDKIRQAQLTKLRFDADQKAVAAGQRGGGIDRLTLEQLQAPQKARAERLTGLGANAEDVDAISAKLKDLDAAIAEATVAQQKAFDTDKLSSKASQDTAKKLSDLQRQSVDLQTALKDLTDSASRSAAAQEKLSRIQEDRSSRAAFGEKFLRGDQGDRRQIGRDLRLVNQAATQGNLNNFRGDQVRTILDTLGSLGGAKTNFGGKNLRANELKDDLLKNSLGGLFDIDAASKKEEQNLIKDIASNIDKSIAANEVLRETLKTTNEKLITDLRTLQTEFFSQLKSQAQAEQIAREKQTISRAEIERGDVQKDKTNFNNLNASLGGDVNQNQIDFLKNNLKDVENLFAKSQESKKLKDSLGLVVGPEFNLSANTEKKTFGGTKETTTIETATQELTKIFRDKTAGLGIESGDLASAITRVQGKIFENPNTPDGKVTFKEDASFRSEIAKELQDLVTNKISSVEREKDVSFQRLAPLGDKTRGALDNLSFNKSFTEFSTQLSVFSNGKTIANLEESLNKLTDEITAAKKRIVEARGGTFIEKIKAAAGKATGGLITKEKDVSAKVFKAKGTDTVPAMLSPGEFVINASATAANKELLERINEGKGKKVNYLAIGGLVKDVAKNAPNAVKKAQNLKQLILPQPDEDFGKYLSGVDDKAFSFLYNQGAPQVLSYYNNLRKSDVVKKGVGRNVAERLGEVFKNLNPDSKADKIKFLQYLPSGDKKRLLGLAERGKQDFNAFNNMDPKTLLKFYSNTVYPFINRRSFETQGKIKNLNIEINKQKQSETPNVKYLEVAEANLGKLKDYYASLPSSSITPAIAKTYDLSVGSEQRDSILKVIKDGYLTSIKAPNLNLQAQNLGLIDKKGNQIGAQKLNKAVQAQEKVLEANGLKAKAVGEQKEVQNKVALDKQREASYLDAVQKIADFKATEMEFQGGKVDKSVLNTFKQTADKSVEKAKKFSNFATPEELISYLDKRASSTPSSKAIFAQNKELAGLKNTALDFDTETVESRAAKISQAQERLKIQEKKRLNGGGDNFDDVSILTELTEPKKALDFIVSYNKNRKNLAANNIGTKNKVDEISNRIEEYQSRRNYIVSGSNQSIKDLIGENNEDSIKNVREPINKWMSDLSDFASVLFIDKGERVIESRIKESDSFKNLRSILENLPNPVKFATGGMVPGAGHGDTVPAMLTPGEFVLNKSAVERVGLANLHQINNAKGIKTEKFASGGPVRPSSGGGSSFGGATLNSGEFSQAVTRFESSMSILKSAFDAFNSAAGTLAQAMQKFPSTISGSFTHAVTVNIQGGEALAALTPELEKLAVNKAKQVLSTYIKNNLPDSGIVE